MICLDILADAGAVGTASLPLLSDGLSKAIHHCDHIVLASTTNARITPIEAGLASVIVVCGRREEIVGGGNEARVSGRIGSVSARSQFVWLATAAVRSCSSADLDSRARVSGSSPSRVVCVLEETFFLVRIGLAVVNSVEVAASVTGKVTEAAPTINAHRRDAVLSLTLALSAFRARRALVGSTGAVLCDVLSSITRDRTRLLFDWSSRLWSRDWTSFGIREDLLVAIHSCFLAETEIDICPKGSVALSSVASIQVVVFVADAILEPALVDLVANMTSWP
mmetsp:Transcript_25490/g.42383  ORF Transcript_25490/g.42383 Transcript_25490/m.42383 type:complete len:280 (-) Transcript_25490:1280-2119(-)